MDQEGLSEVIGFVLILGLITVALSIYLIYGVPAQGRENEILHMNVIQDQFINYKIGLDSLFTNNLVGTTTSNSFSLGTGGGYTQGSNSIFPILSPVSSGGIFMINRRTTLPETLSLTSDSYIQNTGSFSVALPARASYQPNHVYINISGINPTDLNQNGIFGVTANTTAWSATINLTPHSLHYNETKSVTCNPSCLITYNEGERYTSTDITLSVAKGGILTMQDTVVYRNISPYTVYSIDLMDDAYGLKSLTTPQQYISLNTGKTLGSITGTGTITYDFTEIDPYSITPIPLGSIEYRSDNKYWISQTYYYQMGGVFLSQVDGITTYKLPPEISASYNYTSQISTININALSINSPTGGSIVGGNSPVQIKTTLMTSSDLPYVKGTANTRWIRIAVNTSDDQSRVMWKNYFNYTARSAYLPNTITGDTATESYIFINGSDPSPTGAFDINVIGSTAAYSATVYGVGG